MLAADLPRIGYSRHVFDERAQASLGLLAEPLRLLLLRDVLRDLRDTPQFSLIIVQRRQDRACPEPRSILAHKPVLFFGPAFAGRRLEVSLGPATLYLFFGEEHGEVLSDDLLRLIALETFGTSVPAADASLRVEREDRVVSHAFHQRAEVFLVPAQVLPLALGLQRTTLRSRPRGAQGLD